MSDPSFAIDFDAQKRHSGWQAKLALGFAVKNHKTVLAHRQQYGPLAVQRPFYPEKNICHTYLLHPPGGVVGGDTLTIHTDVDSYAHALVTTPGATKFYRSADQWAEQTQRLTVADGGILEWLPQENIFFNDAKVKLNTTIILAETARFMGWEMHCFGRPALNEGFEKGYLMGKTEIQIAEKKILIERFALEGADSHFYINGLQKFNLSSSLYITNKDPVVFEMVQVLLNTICKRYHLFDLVIGVTQLEGLMVIRALANWSETILSVFVEIWQLVRQQWFQEIPVKPRIWAT
ncbi:MULTISPECIES: urease accessory protein UreD [unclassified Photobacterium]|uniref:urease accessory protein UreD n=1 Tax=unclassified Photobacterium TaxID=2628852 RepID=UPI001EDD5983|nr:MULTISPECIES: urease accessory protein UreD [unclassified Photobacterium]MCG3865271.1 urease accessory protein UreD [Photobacterium sp. Ph6]MCG3876770.1 urease accessory protein UreD [Photobacterium sp. Ph5]